MGGTQSGMGVGGGGGGRRPAPRDLDDRADQGGHARGARRDGGAAGDGAGRGARRQVPDPERKYLPVQGIPIDVVAVVPADGAIGAGRAVPARRPVSDGAAATTPRGRPIDFILKRSAERGGGRVRLQVPKGLQHTLSVASLPDMTVALAQMGRNLDKLPAGEARRRERMMLVDWMLNRAQIQNAAPHGAGDGGHAVPNAGAPGAAAALPGAEVPNPASGVDQDVPTQWTLLQHIQDPAMAYDLMRAVWQADLPPAQIPAVVDFAIRQGSRMLSAGSVRQSPLGDWVARLMIGTIDAGASEGVATGTLIHVLDHLWTRYLEAMPVLLVSEARFLRQAILDRAKPDERQAIQLFFERRIMVWPDRVAGATLSPPRVLTVARQDSKQRDVAVREGGGARAVLVDATLDQIGLPPELRNLVLEALCASLTTVARAPG